MTRTLSTEERETQVTYNAASDTALISTHIRSDITRLDKNPAAVCISKEHFGKFVFAEYEIPKGMITFRTMKRTRTKKEVE